jgi:hypothetical protein
MIKIFSKKKNFEEVVSIITAISISKSSPLEKWLSDLTSRNLAELYLNNFVYCWLYLVDNKLTEKGTRGVEHIALYTFTAYQSIRPIIPEMNEGPFIELFKDRLEMLKGELTNFRKTMLLAKQYFPSYYFGRILEYPLENNEFYLEEYYSTDEWSSYELTNMFPHQMNFLQEYLDKYLKP